MIWKTFVGGENQKGTPKFFLLVFGVFQPVKNLNYKKKIFLNNNKQNKTNEGKGK